MFTQPLMYKRIAKHPYIMDIYEKELMDKQIISADYKKILEEQIKKTLEEEYKASKEHKFTQEDWGNEQWEEVKKPEKYGKVKDTGVEMKALKEIGKKITKLPEDFEFHSQIKKIYQARLHSIEEGKGIDWGTAEALAFASLITEGFHVRISGQDCERGTFSHRHAVLHHQSEEREFLPINQVAPTQATRHFIASNSHLSEYAVLGFEYGYSQANPNTLTIWEAQFGDFANGAQVAIDTLIAAGETKWNVKSGLVLLLPHGMDGQGPEHSSARLERFLQLSDDDPMTIPDFSVQQHTHSNWSVVNCTTAANYFHVVRR